MELITLGNIKLEKCEKCYQIRDYINEFNECDSCEKCKRCKNQKRDYLNNFEICDSCCKQMERMTPSIFKPNFKFEKCERCYQREDYLNEFQFCISCCILSENKIIDDFIKYASGKIEYVYFDKFQNIKFVAEGGFSKVYRATWIDCSKCYSSNGILTVALKELNNSKNITSKGLNEVKF